MGRVIIALVVCALLLKCFAPPAESAHNPRACQTENGPPSHRLDCRFTADTTGYQ